MSVRVGYISPIKSQVWIMSRKPTMMENQRIWECKSSLD